MTLTLSLQTEEIRRNEESFQRFQADLAGPNERIRISAINRIPELLARRGQRLASINPFSVLARQFGFGETRIHAAAVRSQVKQLLVEGASDPAPLTVRESRALIDALRRLAPADWFETDGLASSPTGTLDWLWTGTRVVPPGLASEARTLFTGARLRGVDFSDLSLAGADLSRLTCDECRFHRTKISGAHLRGATLRNCQFDFATLDGADLEEAQVENTSFYGTSLRGIRLRKASITNSRFHQPDLASSQESPVGFADLRGITIRDTTFAECRSAMDANFTLATLQGIRFYGCNLNGANFQSAIIDEAVFDGSTLKGSNLNGVSAKRASFVRVDFTGSSLERANLLGADMTGATVVDKKSTVVLRTATNLNIAATRGLNPNDFDALALVSAVQFSCDEAWERYKKAGYPFETWLNYRACGKQ